MLGGSLILHLWVLPGAVEGRSWRENGTVAQLTGAGTVAARAQCAARATNDSEMEGMRKALVHFLELNDYLDDQAIPSTI